MPTQSTAHSTIGPSSLTSTTPRAESRSTTSLAAGTSPSHNGLPKGGVASTWNVPTFNGSAAFAVEAKIEITAREANQRRYMKRLLGGGAGRVRLAGGAIRAEWILNGGRPQ